MASEAIKRMIFKQLFEQGAQKKAQALAKRRGEFVGGLMGQPAQAQETSQFQADTFPGEQPLPGLMNIDQQAQPASGMFDETVSPQQRQMEFNKGLMSSEFPVLQKQGFDRLNQMGGDVSPSDFLGARTFDIGAPENIVDGVNVNKGKVQRARNTTDGGLKLLGEPRYPRDPFKDLGDAFVNANDPKNRMKIENEKKAFDIAEGKSKVERRDKTLDSMDKQISTLTGNISLYGQGMDKIDDGAMTGYISNNFLPSFRQSTIDLDNIGNQLGLQVIQGVTFGALSAGEMKLAMDTAMPRNMQPAALRKWLKDKKTAQIKLRKQLIRYRRYRATHTQDELYEYQDRDEKRQAKSSQTSMQKADKILGL